MHNTALCTRINVCTQLHCSCYAHCVHGLATDLDTFHRVAERHRHRRVVCTEALVACSCLPPHGGQGGVSSCRVELLGTPSSLVLPRVRHANVLNGTSRLLRRPGVCKWCNDVTVHAVCQRVLAIYRCGDNLLLGGQVHVP